MDPLDQFFKNYLDEDQYLSYEDERKQEELEKALLASQNRGMEKPTSFLGKTVDFLSRGNYGAAKAVDIIVNEEGQALSRAWSALKSGFSEIVNPEERLTFSDVIRRQDPLWAQQNPFATAMYGFAADVLIDPINLVSFGSGGVLRNAIRQVTKKGKIVPLSEKGEVVFKKIVDNVAAEGYEGAEAVKRTEQVFQELLDPTDFSKPLEIGRSDPLYKKNVDNFLKAKVSNIAAANPDKARGAGVFVTDLAELDNILEGGHKAFGAALSPQEYRELRRASLAGGQRQIRKPVAERIAEIHPDDRYKTLRAEQVSDSLWRNTDLEEGLNYLESSSNVPNARLWTANSPELALGQGKSKAFTVEFHPTGFEGSINKSKPGLKLLEDQGKVEFSLKYPKPEKLREAVKRIEVDSTQLSRRERSLWVRLNQHIAPDLEKKGWKVTRADGKLLLESPNASKSLTTSGDASNVISKKLLDIYKRDTPSFEISDFTSAADKSKLIDLSKLKGNKIAVVVPRQFIDSKIIGDVAAGKRKLMFNPNYDPNQLRFILEDADELLDPNGVKRVINQRLKNHAAQIDDIKKLGEMGQDALKATRVTVDDLIDSGGMKILGRSVITSDQFKSFAVKLGLPRALRMLKELPGIKELDTLAKGLRETTGLTSILERDFPEWMRQRRHLEVLRHESLESAAKGYSGIFKEISEESRIKIHKLMAETSEETKARATKLGLLEPTEKIGNDVFRYKMNFSDLTVKEKAAMVKLRTALNDFHKFELQAGIAQQYMVNYHPARYEAITSMDRMRDFRAWNTADPIEKGMTFTKERVFANAEEALKAGFKPIEDAGRLYLMRHMEHSAALRKQEWKATLETMFPDGNVPLAIERDLVRLGEIYYPPRHREAGTLAVQLLDRVSKLFRVSATVARPAFAPKQVIGNTTQLMAEMGLEAFKVFDPRTIADSAAIVMNKYEVPFDLVDVWGRKWSKEELTAAVKSLPNLKGVAIEGIGLTGEHDLIRKLTSELYTNKLSTAGSTTAKDGLRSLFNLGYQYLQLPSYVEDLFRVSTFLTGIKTGSAKQAAFEIVDNALFNYTSGLTHAEQMIRRWVIPFYSFQKFGATLMGRILLTKPARLSNMAKTSKAFFETWNKIAGGETLREDERKVLPGLLLDQPNVFEKFRATDERLEAIFRTFNNMAFLDVVNALQVNDNGELDVQETMVKGTLAQMAPWVKVPLEMAMKRQFFTDKALDGVYAGNMGPLNYDRLAENIGALSGLHAGGIVGGAAGGLIGKLAAMGPAEKVIKWVVNWEEAVNPETGKTDVYVNPYMALALTSLLPGLNAAFKSAKEDSTPMDNLLYFTFGIGTAKLDLQEEGIRKVQSRKRDIQQLQREFRTYMRQGRQTMADQALEDLYELFEYVGTEYEAWLSPEIRGGMIPPGENGQ